MHKDLFKFDLICNAIVRHIFNTGKRQEKIRMNKKKEEMTGQNRFYNGKQQ